MKKNEFGRTMFEMLDVLAIMAILSLIGVAGYRLAMSQYKTTEIWNDVQLRARSIRWIKDYNMPHLRTTDQLIETFPSLPSIGKSGYKITGNLHGGDDVFAAFSITVHDVPKNVCEKVKKIPSNEALVISPNNTSETVIPNSIQCSDEKNNIQFYFDNPNGCANHCNMFYTKWKANCGNFWKGCDPDNGFACRQRTTKNNACSGGFRFHCTTHDGNHSIWYYDRTADVFACP